MSYLANMYKIYSAKKTGTNDIRYIGQTTNQISRRRDQHFHYARTYRGKARFHNWIRSVNYQVQFDLLFEFKTKEEADTKERELIANLLNLTNILDGGDSYPESKGNLNGNSKKVIQYSLNGKFIKEFNSIVEAESETGVKAGLISGCISKAKIKSAGGFIWEHYKESYNKKIEGYYTKKPVFSNEKPILQFNLRGRLIKEHPHRTAAADYIGVDRANILYSLKNSKIGSGYIWVYKHEFTKELLENILKRKPYQRLKN